MVELDINRSDSPAVFKLKGLSKEFLLGKVRVAALRQVDVIIKRGEMVALRGPSGSGKSTLLNVLGLLEVPTGGELAFLGNTIRFNDETQLTEIRRREIGFIFQNYNLVPILTALENVEYPLQLLRRSNEYDGIRADALRVLKSVGLETYAHHKPAELSGGQQQRVAIARALVKNPNVILADEPTANLDSKNATAILELLQKLRDELQTTVVIATHDEQVAMHCDRTIQLKDGVVV